MKKNKKILVFVLLLLFYSININAQHKFELSAEFRPRMEQRHGYRNLAPLDSKVLFLYLKD